MNKVTIELEGKTKTVVLDERDESHPFSSGSRGFHGHGKMKLTGGKEYQINILLVEIGSKPKQSEG